MVVSLYHVFELRYRSTGKKGDKKGNLDYKIAEPILHGWIYISSLHIYVFINDIYNIYCVDTLFI